MVKKARTLNTPKENACEPLELTQLLFEFPVCISSISSITILERFKTLGKINDFNSLKFLKRLKLFFVLFCFSNGFYDLFRHKTSNINCIRSINKIFEEKKRKKLSNDFSTHLIKKFSWFELLYSFPLFYCLSTKNSSN